jgi:hypothetical protein
LKIVRSAVSIITVDEKTIDSALSSNISDFEDAVQHFAALSTDCEVIITRNTRDFKFSIVPVLTPEEFLKRL